MIAIITQWVKGMVRTIVAVVVIVVPMGAKGAAADDATPAQGKLKIATYNVENLFDVYDDPYTADETTPVKALKHINALVETIRHIDADVLCLQEVENQQVLQHIVTKKLDGMGYQHVVAGMTNDTRGIRVALVSRLPIVSVTSHRFLDLTLPSHEQTWRFARDLMRVRLRVPFPAGGSADGQRELDVYVVHFKSKRTVGSDTQSRSWRLAEARAARRIIDAQIEADPDRWIVIAGDFNDTPDSPPMQALLAGKADADRSLIDVHAKLPKEHRITYINRPYRSTIDFILASPALAGRLVPGSAKVIADPALLGGADHAPVVATFDLSGN